MKAAAVALAALALAPAASAAPLTVHATFDRPVVRFGEPVTTHVLVRATPGTVRSGSIRVVEDAGPFTVLSSSTRSHDGAVTAVRVVSCLSEACIGARGDATPTLPRVLVSATAADGRTLRAYASWPPLRIRGRVSAADLARARPPFRTDTVPPRPTYAVSPTLLEALLIAAAAVLGLGALLLVGREARRARLARIPPENPLVRALRLMREAETRPPPDRRRAVGLLAQVLSERGRPLANAATDLAWSRPTPERDALERLAAEVEREATA